MATKIKGRWKCEGCGGTFDIKEYPNECPDCRFSREDSEKLQNKTHWHCKSCKVVVKNGEKCPKCGKTDPNAEEPVKTWDCKWCGKTGISEKEHPKYCPNPKCGHERGTSPPPPKTWDCKWCGKTGISEKEHPKICPNPKCGHERGTSPKTWICPNPKCHEKILEKDHPDKCPVCGADRYPKPDPDPVTWDCKWCGKTGISEKEHPKICPNPKCGHERGTFPPTPGPSELSWYCYWCKEEIDAKKYPRFCPRCKHERGTYPPPPQPLPLKKILLAIALIAIVYLVGLHMVTNPDVPLIQIVDETGSATQTPTVIPTEAVILGAFTVTDGQNPSKSASLPDGQKGVVYNNTLSFPYGSPYYVLGITDVVPPVTITASNMVPTNTQASLELQLKDSDGNTVDTIQLGSSDTKRSKKITIREAGNYILIMDGKYVDSVVITIEKT